MQRCVGMFQSAGRSSRVFLLLADDRVKLSLNKRETCFSAEQLMGVSVTKWQLKKLLANCSKSRLTEFKQ